MNLNPESCLTILTFILAAVYMSLGEGQSTSCNSNSRPHPQGICGPRLSRAHSNLCFLLSQAYPNHFPGKRSLDNGHLDHKIYSVPLSMLAERDWSNNWGDVQAERAYQNAFTNDGLLSGDITEISTTDNQANWSPMTGRKRAALMQTLAKRSETRKRVVAKSRLVCDCCYNICTPRHLATYC